MNESRHTLRSAIGRFFTDPMVIVSVIILTSSLMALFGGIGFLVGLLIALITFWSVRWQGSYFGISLPDWGETIFDALAYTLLLILVVDVAIQPHVELLTGAEHDLSSLDHLRGNFMNWLKFYVFMWVIAGFGEEFFFRGYIMKRIANLLEDDNRAWILGALLSSSIFGIVHFYQGISGIITTGVVGLILAYAFYRNRNNLVLCMLIHGFYDTFGLAMIYFNQDRLISDWVQSWFIA